MVVYKDGTQIGTGSDDGDYDAKYVAIDLNEGDKLLLNDYKNNEGFWKK